MNGSRLRRVCAGLVFAATIVGTAVDDAPPRPPTMRAGLRVLEQAGVRAALLDAVLAATERSVELGRSAG